MIQISDSRKRTKGVSVILGYSITLIISVMLLGALISAFGSQLDHQKDSAIRTELKIASGQIVTELEKADATIRNTGKNSDIIVKPQFTDKASNSGYIVSFTKGPPQPNIYALKMESQEVTVIKPFRSNIPVDINSKAYSAGLRVVYNQNENEFELANDSIENTIYRDIPPKRYSGDYTIPANTVHKTDIIAGGAVTGGSGTIVRGYIDAGGDITTDSNLDVYGYIKSTGSITLSQDTNVLGKVTSSEPIVINDGSSIGGNLKTDTGTITVRQDSNVDGDITAPSDITIETNGYVSGSITSANGTVYLNDGVVVSGDVYVDSASQLNCSGTVKINSYTCSEYKAKNY